MRFWHFLQYNNAVPIAISIVLLGAGGAFAATDPQAVYSSSQQVISVDNTYLVNKDLSQFRPSVLITGVTEDADNYYVAYNLSTIDLKDSVWQDVTKQVILNVSKADLSASEDRDLGLYVTEQLKEITDHELSYLKQVQGIEKQHVTQKVVATQYGGLVGKFLDPTTDTLPGYTPVIAPPPPAPVVSAQQPFLSIPTATTSTPDQQSQQSQQTSQNQQTQQTPPQTGNVSLTIQVLGNNPAQVPLGTRYVDLGATATDGQNDTIRIDTYLDGNPVSQVTIDTTATSTHRVRYIATDSQNNSVAIERSIVVFDPSALSTTPADAQASSTASDAQTSTTTSNTTQTPNPTPNPTSSPDTQASSSAAVNADTPAPEASTSTTPSDTASSTTP